MLNQSFVGNELLGPNFHTVQYLEQWLMPVAYAMLHKVDGTMHAMDRRHGCDWNEVKLDMHGQQHFTTAFVRSTGTTTTDHAYASQAPREEQMSYSCGRASFTHCLGELSSSSGITPLPLT